MESAQSSQNSKSDGGASSGDENTTTPSIKANEGSVNGDEANDESQAVKPVEVKMETDSAMDSSASSNGQADKAEESGSEQAANSRKRKAEDSISSGNESSAETPKPTSDNDVAPVLEAQTSDLSMPPKQTLGKGKRARIPNKRYSDIILSPQSLSRKSTFENGDKTSERLESESELNDTVEEMPPQVTTPKPLPPAPSSSAVKKPKLTIDISSPQYKAPMSQGWRRELVYRSSHDPAKKVNGDIYYHTPKGRKIRSMRELAEYLRQENSELTLDNFSFLREPIGFNDPEKEIVRPAKAWPKKQSKGGLKTSPKSSKGSPGLDGSTASPKNRTLTRNLGNFKVKLPPTKTKAEKQKAKEEEAAMETESPGSRRQTSRRTAKVPPKTFVESPSKSAASRRTSKSSTTTNDGGGVSNKIDKSKFMDSYLQNLNYGYTTLLHVFQYLKVQDLLRAACVCRMWRDIANHPSLWRTVRMKNSQVHSFEGLANSLQKHGTVQLDLRKMLLPGGDDIWPEFSKAIKKVETLRKIELCRCPASVVESLLETNTDLEVINAVTIKCDKLNLDKLSNVKKLKEVRIKSSSTGLTLTSNITSLNELTNLMHLSLTSIKSLHELDLKVIALLSNLETLELGECNDFPENFGSDILLQLNKLEKLRLEKGQDNCHTFEILEAVKIMPKLEQLELINFDIKSGFDLALGACTNLKKLLIIPTYISQSATTNHMVLGGVLRLQKTISHFVWGITLELLRVTELFVDQCDDSDIKEKKEKKPSGGSGDSIPVLKPVPSIVNSDDSILPANDPPQVDILPLANLQKLLMKSLPTTRVKILKIPYHATWRQSITEFC